MNKKWIFKEIPDLERIKNLSGRLKIDSKIATILVQRGIDNFEKAKHYFRPSLKKLYSPFLLKDMDLAVQRILTAIEENQNILIYGDYDVDGTTGIAVMYHFLKLFSSHIHYYSPDRYSEGYGISKKAIEWVVEKKIDLMITVDCGIRDIENAQELAQKGVDLIVSDHHEPGQTLPKALAIVNPKRKDCDYPFDGLSGCAIAFKIVQALGEKKNINPIKVYSYLDLVAVSIAADIVPMVDENRILAYYGLRVLQHNPRPGLKIFLKDFENTKITISKLVFNIAPRINAAGRIDHAKLAIQLLLAEDMYTAKMLFQKVDKNNETRRSIDLSITDEALQLIEAEKNLKNTKTTVLYKNDWHKGVIGIVASRCIEKYYRPTIILTESNGKAVGSARSVEGFNVYKAIDSCNEFLEKYGGHAFAAGITLNINLIEKFKQKFNDIVSRSIDENLLIPSIKIDLLISLDDVNWKFLKILNLMSPFGPYNLAPTFVSRNIIINDYRILKDKHLKIIIKQADSEAEFEAIGFGKSHLTDIIKINKLYKMAYKIEENNFNGKKSISLRFEDLKEDS